MPSYLSKVSTVVLVVIMSISIVQAQTSSDIITEAEITDLDGFPFDAGQFDPIAGDCVGNIMYFGNNGDSAGTIPAIYSFDITADESVTAATLIVDSDDITGALSLTNRVHFAGHIVADGTTLFAICAEDSNNDGSDFVSHGSDLERLIRIDTTAPAGPGRVTEMISGGLDGLHWLEVVGSDVYLGLNVPAGASNNNLMKIDKTATAGSASLVLSEATMLAAYSGPETFVDIRSMATDGTDLFFCDSSDAIFKISDLTTTPVITEITNGVLGVYGITVFYGLEVFSNGNFAVLDNDASTHEGVFTCEPDGVTQYAFVDETVMGTVGSIFQQDMTLGPSDTIIFADNASPERIQLLSNPTGVPVELSAFGLE